MRSVCFVSSICDLHTDEGKTKRSACQDGKWEVWECRGRGGIAVLPPRSRLGTRCSLRFPRPLRSGAPLPRRRGLKGTLLTLPRRCSLEKPGQGRGENQVLKISCGGGFLGKGLSPPPTHPLGRRDKTHSAPCKLFRFLGSGEKAACWFNLRGPASLPAVAARG